MTLSSLLFELLEMSSAVKPSAKYSSRGDEDMLARDSLQSETSVELTGVLDTRLACHGNSSDHVLD